MSPPREGEESIYSEQRGEEPPLTSSSLVWFWGCGELEWRTADSGGPSAPAPQSTPPPERLHCRAATQPEVPTLPTLRLQATKAARVPHSLPGSCGRPLSRVLATRHLERGSSQGIQGAINVPLRTHPGVREGEVCCLSSVPSPQQAPLTSAPQAPSPDSALLPLPNPISTGPSPSSHPHPPCGLSSLSMCLWALPASYLVINAQKRGLTTVTIMSAVSEFMGPWARFNLYDPLVATCQTGKGQSPPWAVLRSPGKSLCGA